MSWESTAVCHRRPNEQVRDRLSGLHSAGIRVRSLDFTGGIGLQKQGRWEASQLMARIARALDEAGVRRLPICISTIHTRSDEVRRAVAMPLHTGVAVDFSMLKQPSHPRAA
jgi:aspartate/glutamate racemase